MTRSITASVSAALFLAALFAGTGALLIALVERGAVPPRPVMRAQGKQAARVDHAAIELAGSGANLVLTRLLVDGFLQQAPGAPQVVVHDSIGSGGGLRALRDGVIDAALVSRPLRPEEAKGMAVMSYARAAVVFAAHRGVAPEALDHADLLALYEGKRIRWRDGRNVVLVQRERGDSAHAVVDAAVPGFAAANQAAWQKRRFPVAITDDEMVGALLRTEGAGGLMDFGTIRSQALALNVFAFNGVEPSVAALETGRYPLTRDLALVTRALVPKKLLPFLAFLRSQDAAGLMRAAGYLPTAERSP